VSVRTVLAFALIISIGIITPGPTVLLALTNGSRLGLRLALFGMLGAIVADFALVSLVGLGLGAFLETSETLFTLVKWLGVAWLTFLGISLLRSQGGFAKVEDASRDRGTPSPHFIFAKSFTVAMSNPKYYLFMSAFLPQFIDTHLPQRPQYAILASVMASIDLLAMFGYASFGVQAARFLKRGGAKLLNQISGAALLALAGTMALYRRAAH